MLPKNSWMIVTSVNVTWKQVVISNKICVAGKLMDKRYKWEGDVERKKLP